MQFLQIFFKYQFCYLEKCTKFKIHSYLIFFSYFTGHNWLNAKKCTSTSKMICQKIELPFYPSNYHNCLKKFFYVKIVAYHKCRLGPPSPFHSSLGLLEILGIVDFWRLPYILLNTWRKWLCSLMKTHLARHCGPKIRKLFMKNLKLIAFCIFFYIFFSPWKSWQLVCYWFYSNFHEIIAICKAIVVIEFQPCIPLPQFQFCC